MHVQSKHISYSVGKGLQVKNPTIFEPGAYSFLWHSKHNEV